MAASSAELNNLALNNPALMSMEEVQNALDVTAQELADVEWETVQAEDAANKIQECEDAHPNAMAIAPDLVQAIGVAQYVIETAVAVQRVVDQNDPDLTGVPKADPRGGWQDGGRFDEKRKVLFSIVPLLDTLLEQQEQRVQIIEAFYARLEADVDSFDETSAEWELIDEQVPRLKEEWVKQLLGVARRVYQAQRATIVARDLLNNLPTKPPIDRNLKTALYVIEQTQPQALSFPFAASKSSKNRGASPPAAPSPTPAASESPSPPPPGSPGASESDHLASLERQMIANPDTVALDTFRKTPCEYFDKHMRTADPILMTYYSMEAIKKDWAYWRSQTPPQMPTMNCIFLKGMYPDWTTAYTEHPVHTSAAIGWVVENSLPIEGLDASWRNQREGERFFLIDGTNLFYKPTIKQWDEFRRIAEIKASAELPEGKRYGPIIIVVQSHIFENNILKYNDAQATFLSDTGIRLIHDMLRPLHGGYDYPIHIVEVCAELCAQTFDKKSGDARFPCIDMAKEAGGRSACRLLPDSNPAHQNVPRKHSACEYDDCVGTLINEALVARGNTVRVVTGEGGNNAAEGIKKYLKPQSEMEAMWKQMREMSTRAKTRVYRMGYNRVVRNFADPLFKGERASQQA